MKNLFNKIDATLKKKLQNISLIALDFDGVLTDNKVIHDQNGKESVSRSRADSLAIDLLQESGLYNKESYGSLAHKLDIVILSRESNKVVLSVAEKMKIKCHNSIDMKCEALKKQAQLRNIDLKKVLFIGNDLNDFECMNSAGVSVAVADAVPQIIECADYVTLQKGGEGAFREVCELMLYIKALHPFMHIS